MIKIYYVEGEKGGSGKTNPRLIIKSNRSIFSSVVCRRSFLKRPKKMYLNVKKWEVKWYQQLS